MGFKARNRIMDELELHPCELGCEPGSDAAADPQMGRHASTAAALRDRLQRMNDAMVEELRKRIAGATITSRALLETLWPYASWDRQDRGDHIRYDDLDVLVAALFATDCDVDHGTAAWDPDMERYQPTPARLLLARLQGTQLTERDLFVDLGSGLGTVPMLVSLLTEARAIGIEWHPGYDAYARRCARGLNLSSVDFIHQDVRHADLSAGTIFYLFTPFKGAMLREVIRRLDDEGRRRPIRLWVHGPLLREALQEWSSFSLETVQGHADPISIFQSTPRG